MLNSYFEKKRSSFEKVLTPVGIRVAWKFELKNETVRGEPYQVLGQLEPKVDITVKEWVEGYVTFTEGHEQGVNLAPEVLSAEIEPVLKENKIILKESKD